MKRSIWAAAVAAVLAVVVVACSSSSSTTTVPATIGDTSGCGLSPEAASQILGVGANSVVPPELGSGVPVPLSRCAYEVDGRTLQFTAFPGPEMLSQLATLMSNAEPTPDVGPGAYCSTYQRESTATVGCVFLNDRNTVTLSLNVPSARLSSDLQAAVRVLATTLAGSSLTGSTQAPGS